MLPPSLPLPLPLPLPPFLPSPLPPLKPRIFKPRQEIAARVAGRRRSGGGRRRGGGKRERREEKGKRPSSWYPLPPGFATSSDSALLLGAGGVFSARDSFFSDCFL
jgi:hypothetical protein